MLKSKKTSACGSFRNPDPAPLGSAPEAAPRRLWLIGVAIVIAGVLPCDLPWTSVLLTTTPVREPGSFPESRQVTRMAGKEYQAAIERDGPGSRSFGPRSVQPAQVWIQDSNGVRMRKRFRRVGITEPDLGARMVRGWHFYAFNGAEPKSS